jgi:hypothetical protein
MNFCGKCGAKLERICPQCHWGNPAEYKFCGKCGYNLYLPSESITSDLSFDEKLDKIQKYLPKGLAESGTTYVTEDTFKLTEGLFRFEALGEKQVKGRKKPK